MSEMWRESYEHQNSQLLDDLDTLFEAASLRYLDNEAQMADGLFGKPIRDHEDSVMRVTFANWHTKSRIVVEKPLEGAGEAFTRSMFSDEKSNIVFTLYIFDLLQEDLEVPSSAEIGGDVEYLHIEVYDDSRVTLMYFGRPEYVEEDDDEVEILPNVSVVTSVGAALLGVDCSEEGSVMHTKIHELIRSELGLEYWKYEYKNSLNASMDVLVRYCTENEN